MSLFGGALTLAYTSLTNCTWEGVCSQMEVHWVPTKDAIFIVEQENMGIKDLTNNLFHHLHSFNVPVLSRNVTQIVSSFSVPDLR